MLMTFKMMNVTKASQMMMVSAARNWISTCFGWRYSAPALVYGEPASGLWILDHGRVGEYPGQEASEQPG